MKRIIYIIMFIPSLAICQTLCHTPAITQNQLQDVCKLKGKKLPSINNAFFLKVYFHIIRRSNMTGGQTISNVNDSFEILNNDFNPYNIYFVWDGTIDYIDSDTYFYDINYNIFTYNNHNNGIDIYLTSNEVNTPGGLANGIGNGTEFYVGGQYWKPPYNNLAVSHCISHEMGHILNLWHTHHGTYNEGGNDTNQCAEYVDGTNSDVCGDYIEDTPADPCLQFNVDSSTGAWLGSGQDAHGSNYIPDTHLIMSYTDVNCMSYFSFQQAERMKNAIRYLPQLRATNMTISGSAFLCSQEVYTINNMPSEAMVLLNTNYSSSGFSIQVSSNLEIVSYSNGEVTVKKLSDGFGFIKVYYKGLLVDTHEIWVGGPVITNLYYIGGVIYTEAPIESDPFRFHWKIGNHNFWWREGRKQYPLQNGTYNVETYAENLSCGAGPVYTTQIIVTDSHNFALKKVDNNHIITLDPIDYSESPLPTEITTTYSTSNIFYAYTLHNISTHEVVAKGKISSKGGTLNFSNICKGLYELFLITDFGNVESFKIQLK